MNRNRRSGAGGTLAMGWLLAAFLAGSLEAGVLRTQTIQIQAGWNAVFLEVNPVDGAPEVVFAGTQVDIAARFFPVTTTVEFITDPDETPWQKAGWGVWYAPDRPDAVLGNLHAIQGNCAYLVHARNAFLWNLEGEVAFKPIRWKVRSFNLVGFGVDPQMPPTFGRFFAGAEGQIGERIYRLVGGKWQPVSFPETTLMRSGEACWVYCRSKTDFQGPLRVEADGAGGLDYGALTEELGIRLANTSGVGLRAELEQVAVAGPMPLRQIVQDPATLRDSYPPLPARLELPLLAPGEKTGVTLQVRREEMTAPSQSSLLKCSTDGGMQIWIPVQAQRRVTAR